MNSDGGVKTNVGKNRRNRQKKVSKDTEEIDDKMKSITIADVENHTGVKTSVGKKRSYDNSVGVKEKVEEVSMKSNDDTDDSWGHDHSKCLEQQELSRARWNNDDELFLFREMLRKMKMHKMDVERMKRLEEEADRIKMGILRQNKTYMSEAQRSAINALLFRTDDQSK